MNSTTKLRLAALYYANCMVQFYAARESKFLETEDAADNFDRIQSEMLNAEADLHRVASEVSREG